MLLAAGAGRRFGGGKQLAPWHEGTVLGAALAVALTAPARAVTLVSGSDAAAVEAEAAIVAGRLGSASRLRLVRAEDWAEGMGASLRRGLAALPADAEGAYVFLADMPRVPSSILATLARALHVGAAAAAPSFQGRRGHPVLLGRGLFEQARGLSGDQGARGLLDALGPRLALVEASDDGVLFDVDTPADLEARGG